MPRTLAIGDIHGCSAALDALLSVVKPTPDDLIVTLGDYVHRGPDTPGVLDRLVALHRAMRVVSLRGNHEELYLDIHERKDIPGPHLDFIENTCRDWYETDTHIFVHANALPNLPLDQQPIRVLRWVKLYDEMGTHPHQSGKIMVCGHSSQKSGVPLNLGFAVCIDTYCSGGGWLTCLDTGTNRIWQADQRGRVVEGQLPPPTVLGKKKA